MKSIKFTEQLPPYNGTKILIAMRYQNMGDAGIWLYDVFYYVGGKFTYNDNWEGKHYWEIPIYWAYIEEPKKNC